MNESEPMHWFQAIESYLDPGGTLGVTDEQIQSATPFDGYKDDYLSWPKALWKDVEKGVPCHDLDKNAFHVLHLAGEMSTNQRWVGRHLEINQNGYVVDGHHRIRAVKYLFQQNQILIPEPKPIQIHLRGKNWKAEPEAVISGSVAVLSEIKLLMEKLGEVIPTARVAEWLWTPQISLENQTPFAAIKRGEFSRVLRVIREVRSTGEAKP